MQRSTFQPSKLNVHVFPRLPSTNPKVWELLDQGGCEGTTVIALEQELGKGQWGRQWSSPPGGLYLSFALAPNLPISEAAQLTFAIAWGIASTLQALQIPVQLKWPNDLVLGRLKLGGILTETRIQQGQIQQAVVGVGLNWQNSVPPTGINLQSYLLQHAVDSLNSLEALAATTLSGIVLGADTLRSKGIDALLQDYVKLLVNLGEHVTVAGRSGTIVGVSPTGDLLIQLPRKSSVPSAGFEVEGFDTIIPLKPGTISLGYGSTG